MKRVDFLLCCLAAVVLLYSHENVEGSWAAYVGFLAMVIFGLLAWLKQIEINQMKKMLNIANEDFCKEYEHLFRE